MPVLYRTRKKAEPRVCCAERSISTAGKALPAGFFALSTIEWTGKLNPTILLNNLGRRRKRHPDAREEELCV